MEIFIPVNAEKSVDTGRFRSSCYLMVSGSSKLFVPEGKSRRCDGNAPHLQKLVRSPSAWPCPLDLAQRFCSFMFPLC